MDTIIEQLDQYRAARNDAAQARYSEILQRFDAPRAGDAEALDAAMVELKIDRHQLEHDVHLIQRYRGYLHESETGNDPQARAQARSDAQGIRNGSKELFAGMK